MIVTIVSSASCATPSFRRFPFLRHPQVSSLWITRYLWISILDILFCISIILSCIFFISFSETLPLPIAMDISII